MPKKDITTDDVTSLAKNLLINRLPVVNVLVCSQVDLYGGICTKNMFYYSENHK